MTRELEDLAALIQVAGGEAHLLGISSGGMYALEAAVACLLVRRMAVYEIPYDVDPIWATATSTTGATSAQRLRRGDA